MAEQLPFDVNDPDHDDPIVNQVRQIRREIMEEFNHERAAYDRYLLERERQHPGRLAKLRPRRIRRTR